MSTETRGKQLMAKTTKSAPVESFPYPESSLSEDELNTLKDKAGEILAVS